jgi:hypothetical protein
MASKSIYLANATLDHFLGGPAFSPPAVLLVGLFTTSPTPSTAGVEVSGTGYARVQVPNTSATWTPAAAGSKSNASPITFPVAGGSWGTVVAVGLFNESGTLLYFGPLTASLTVTSGEAFTIPTGAFVASES